MSAYICEDSVFSTLGAFAALTLDQDAQRVADILARENVRSVNHRYNDTDEAAPVDMSAAEFAPNRAQLLALVDEYDYQAGECDDYRQTEAARLVSAIRSAAVAFVPGDDSKPAPDSLIGRALYDTRLGRRGYVVDQEQADGQTYTIGAGGLQPDSRLHVCIVWMPAGERKTLAFSREPLNRAAAMLESRYNWEPITPRQAARLLAEYETEQNAAQRARELARQEKDAAATEFRDQVAEIIPAGAKAVIVAELQQNCSDSMSDYFASKTTRVVVLGFSLHTRDLFPEMRKALKAADLEDLPNLVALGDPEQSEENREKYSGGRGYYLSESGSSGYSGWQVRKVSAWRGDLTAEHIPVGEIRVPTAKAPARKQKAAPAADGVTVRLNDEKKGIEVAFPGKPPQEVRERLKAQGFRWSRAGGFWYAKQSPERLAFARGLA